MTSLLVLAWTCLAWIELVSRAFYSWAIYYFLLPFCCPKTGVILLKHHYSRFLKRINVSKYLFKRACDHRMYLKDLIEKGLHFLLIFLTCCWGAYSGVTVIYFYLHLKTEETKKYNVSKLPMPKKNQNTVAPFVLTQQLFFSFGGFRRPCKKHNIYNIKI